MARETTGPIEAGVTLPAALVYLDNDQVWRSRPAISRWCGAPGAVIANMEFIHSFIRLRLYHPQATLPDLEAIRGEGGICAMPKAKTLFRRSTGEARSHRAISSPGRSMLR